MRLLTGLAAGCSSRPGGMRGRVSSSLLLLLLLLGLGLFTTTALHVPVTAASLLQEHHQPYQQRHNSSSGDRSHLNPAGEHHGIHVASWRWDEIGVFFTFTVFIVITGLAKVAFHHAHWLSSRVPESCLMIIMGVAVGGVLFASGVVSPEQQAAATDHLLPGHSSHSSGPHGPDEPEPAFTLPVFTPRLFFLVLLPPVILESAYSLYDRAFADNIYTVLLYAVVGTLFNTFTIGPLLLLVSHLGVLGSLAAYGGATSDYSLSLLDALVFSSLISAVDPVAVLAIFQEVGVNKDLYFLVFGESLLNDAVTVVLYTTVVTFTEMPVIQGEQYALAVLAFFTVSCGGLAVGLVFGLLTALITKTTENCRVVEPLAVLGMAYLSYLSAELFHFSGIISIIGCGLVQAHYALKNISHKSYTTVKYFTKMLSSTSDAIIFLFLGMVLVSDQHVWHTGFVMWTLVLCLICRFAGVFLLTAVNNLLSVRQIAMQEQFIMAYGGLRGAVSFSLVQMLDGSLVAPRQLFVTATLVVILFTVFLQGGTIKYLVELLHIERNQGGHKKLHEEIGDHVISMIMAGIEEIAGARGDYYIRRKLETFDDHYLKKVFMNPDAENDLTRLFEKLTLTEHFAHLYGPVTLVEDQRALFGGGLGSQESLEEKEKMQLGLARLSDLFPDVELRRRGTMMVPPYSPTPSMQPGTTMRRGLSLTDSELPSASNALAIRKAVRNTPYQRFHYKHNRNLIDDDYQELREHLQRRLMTARRITHMAAIASRHQSAQSAVPSSAGGVSGLDPDPEFLTQPRRQVLSELQGVYPEDLVGMEAIFNRTNRRLSLARQRSLSASERFGQSLSDDEGSNAGFPTGGAHPPPPGSSGGHLRNINEAEADELLLAPFPHPHVVPSSAPSGTPARSQPQRTRSGRSPRPKRAGSNESIV